MSDIIKNIRTELRESADEKTKLSTLHFFKEQILSYGVKSKKVGEIAKNYFPKNYSKQEIFDQCEILFKSGYIEESFIACDWSYRVHKKYEPDDFKIFQSWLQYISNWATCDTFCNHTVGDFIIQFPKYLEKLKLWAKSDNIWVKRASAVSLIIPAKKGLFLNDIFDIADILLHDPNDMVQKGYGWMLKVASQPHLNEVFNYVMKNKKTMPRTALRYAIEKMPPELKKQAMEK